MLLKATANIDTQVINYEHTLIRTALVEQQHVKILTVVILSTLLAIFVYVLSGQ